MRWAWRDNERGIGLTVVASGSVVIGERGEAPVGQHALSADPRDARRPPRLGKAGCVRALARSARPVRQLIAAIAAKLRSGRIYAAHDSAGNSVTHAPAVADAALAAAVLIALPPNLSHDRAWSEQKAHMAPRKLA